MAALGVRSLALLFGAGFSGSYLYNHLDKARSIAARILREVEQNAGDGSKSDTAVHADVATSNLDSTPHLNELSRQLASLSREVNRSRSDQLLIMPSYKGSLGTITDIFNLIGWGVAAVSIGGVMYYVAYRKKFRLTDLAWVSQSTFTGTVEAMQKGITRVSGALGAVKREITLRLREVEGRVDGVKLALADQIDRDVGAVKEGVAEVGDEVAGVKNALGDVNERIDQLDNKIDFATSGIVALVKALSSVAPERIKPGSPFYDLRKFADLSDTNSANSGMLRHRLSAGGLRGLLTGEGGGDNEVVGKRRSMDLKSTVS
ncbi:unnamed protein product [Agarophyton chilense]